MSSLPSPPPGPSSARLIDPAAKDAFWLAVEDCLIRFHQIDTLGAIHRARSARQAAESTPAGIDGDILYHAEPFYVACDIAGMDDIQEQERLLAQRRRPYDLILEQRGW
jgi:hypothetical protein